MSTNQVAPQTKRQMQMKLQRELIESNQLPTCTNCEFFDIKDETCGKFGGKRPPLAFVVTGCEEWIGNIPF
jgi:hypothetical protein